MCGGRYEGLGLTREDGGKVAKFEILTDDMPSLIFCGSTPSACHQQLLEAINASWGARTVPVEPKGAKFFGLSHSTIQNFIQGSSGVRTTSESYLILVTVTQMWRILPQ